MTGSSGLLTTSHRSMTELTFAVVGSRQAEGGVHLKPVSWGGEGERIPPSGLRLLLLGVRVWSEKEPFLSEYPHTELLSRREFVQRSKN